MIDNAVRVLVTSYTGSNGRDYAAALKKSYEELSTILHASN